MLIVNTSLLGVDLGDNRVNYLFLKGLFSLEIPELGVKL